MGIDPRRIGAAVRKAAGVSIVAGRARPKLEPAIAGAVMLTFRGAPPTVTHQAKKLKPIGDWKHGRGRMTLGNSPALEAAHEWYRSRIPPRGRLVPIRGPVVAHVTFWFEPTRKADPRQAFGWPHEGKPDRDNAAKVLFDELVIAGYLVDDSVVFAGPIVKLWAGASGGHVDVTLRTWLGPADDLHALTPHAMTDGLVYPISELMPPATPASQYAAWGDSKQRTDRAVALLRAAGALDAPRGRAGRQRAAASSNGDPRMSGAQDSSSRQNRSDEPSPLPSPLRRTG